MAISDCEDKTPIATSPASSGPAGAHFEGQVGAFYLLSMLTGAEPRGLPGTMINRVELQRAAECHPLDDVIVHAHNALGSPAVLEIQVKRSITFTPKDPIFRAVVDQIARASQNPEFRVSCYELAIATERTSGKIGAYQDVLTWARQLGDATTFTSRINRPGSANDDMRTFVRTFKTHLHNSGAPDDDETVWFLLSRLQILMFDFTFPGSVSETLVKERAAHALHPDDALRVSAFWGSLVDLTLQVAASGGDRTRDRLIENLTSRSFRLAGAPRYTTVRAALSEYSKNALSDISNHIGGVMLTRHEHIGAIHAALNDGRYVEIRGDAGVGKSGVLKHFAQQIAAESQVVVLSPGRTIPKGWTAMRAALGFDGTARDLLVDIAAGGGATLFIDNLDLFDDEERRTVVDIIREAAGVPGFSVIVTARRNFGIEEPNWLPAETLDRLGRTEPLMIGELSDAEVGEIKHTAPALSSLLIDNHPARKVARNLFRLGRLANRQGDEPTPRTEVDMAEQWWQSADGKRDDNHRERARLLKFLADQALLSAGPFDVSAYPPSAIKGLVISETLRDLGNDRVAFQHDVLREWAIANLLHADPTAIERLPLDRSAPAAFERGVELAARMSLERSTEATQWQSLLKRLSCEDVHGAWRRAVLLALVRSEIASELLTRASALLIADRACLLRELIRTLKAVDVEPASRRFAALGVDPAIIPVALNINFPRGPSWYRLIRWLLSFGQSLPTAAIPEVVDLYTMWSTGTLGHDQLTPLLLKRIYHWLTEIETARDTKNFHDLREPFNGEFDRDQIRSLESDLRNGFLLYCNRTPALAAEYLQSLAQRKHKDDEIRNIMKFRGALAQAAPAELAEFTANALIRKRRRSKSSFHQDLDLDEPFDFIDHQFFPASPSQGPFYELLIHSRQHGLSLIHRLVEHAVSFHFRGGRQRANTITIGFVDCERAFPCRETYGWSREMSSAPSCVTSALMALEAWAHGRIDAGETIDKVLDDVLGPQGSPAAYLLVAVDLLLSHWPKTSEASVPFLACPELVCMDRERQPFERGVTHQKEPTGAISLKSLKMRASRSHSLYDLFAEIAMSGSKELREALIARLRRVSVNLGLPTPEANLGYPAFMAVHAINLLNPENWRKILVPQPDGTQRTAREYVAPEAEDQHLAPLREALQRDQAPFQLQSALGLALEDPSRSSPELVKAAVEWAKTLTFSPQNETSHDYKMRDEAVITAAMIVLRDGDAELRIQNEAWARTVFSQALQINKDPVHHTRSGLRFNPVAIAFIGIVHLLKYHYNTADMCLLLRLAAGDPAAAQGFGTAAEILASIDERFPPSVLRCAFVATIWPHQKWGMTEELIAKRLVIYRKKVETAVNAELTWLDGAGPEPAWPDFTPKVARARRHLRVSGGEELQDPPTLQPEEYVRHETAGLWLSKMKGLFDVVARPWLRDIARAYSHWTAKANGAGFDISEEVDRPPSEWNNAYFDLMAHCLPGLSIIEIEQSALAPIISLPEKPFFDVLTHFLRAVDDVYFNACTLQEASAVSIRIALAKRMMASRGWKWLHGSATASVEIHIGPAIATLFFDDYFFGTPPKCYLFEQGVDRVGPFLPMLEELAEKAPSVFVAAVTLSLAEVSPRSTHLQFVAAAAKAWLTTFPDNTSFWVEQDIGRRLCVWLEHVLQQEPSLLDADKAIRGDVDRLLAALVSLGVADARRLEESLR